jgi:hypothetical protein
VPTFEIAALVAVLAAGWFWLDTIKARDAAVAASRRACESEGLQFLDDTVSLTRLRPERDDAGVLRVRRVYGFEYSDTGNDRHPGSVVMLGHRVLFLSVALSPTEESPPLH